MAKRLVEVRRQKNAATSQPAFRAFPAEGDSPAFIALHIPKEMIPPAEMLALSDGVLLRFRSSEGFRHFMVQAMEHGALVWPDLAMEWKDEESEQ